MSTALYSFHLHHGLSVCLCFGFGPFGLVVFDSPSYSTGLYGDLPSFAGLFHVVSSQASLQLQISELFKAALLAAASDLQGAALDPLVATADPRFGDYQCKVDEI